MADTPKNQTPGRGPAPQPPRQRPTTPARRAVQRRSSEERSQFLVVVATAAAIGVAVLAIAGGILYDQVWLPSRPVASVGSESLSRRDYWGERRLAYIREIVQNFQLLALFGGNPQFTQQFQGQSPRIDNAIENLRSAEVEDQVVSAWQDRLVKEQGAQGLGISASDDEVIQALAVDLGQIFLPPPAPPVTTTATVAPTGEATAAATGEATAAATGEATAAATTSAAGTAAPTGTAGGATATPAATETTGPTSTPEPTFTPEPTPQPAEAATQVDQILTEIFRRYELEMAAAGAEPSLTRDDFRAALNDQYRERVLNTKIQEQLVPEAAFTANTDPEKVRARQILVAVDAPEGQTPSDADFAAARTEAEAIVAELRGGADFVELAQERSDDPGSREQGGDLGLFDMNGVADNGATYPPELASAAFSLDESAISDPIRTQFGWHIITVTERQVDSVEEQLRVARTEALDKWVEEQRAAIGVQRFPEPTPSPTALPEEPTPSTVPTYLPGPPTPEPTLEPTPEATSEAATTPEATTTGEAATPAATSTARATAAATTTPTAAATATP